MSTDPDEIRADIERTRSELSSDVDALTDKVSPGQVAHRQVDKLRSAATSVKDRVVGSVSDGTDAAGSTASSLADKTSSLADKTSSLAGKTSSLPGAARDRAAGNPLAAGLIAFGAGLLAASLLPSTRREQQVAQSAKDQAGPVVDQVKGAAQEAAEHLKEPAQEAVAAVKGTATDAAGSVQEQGRSAAQDVRSETTGGDTSSSDDSHGAHVADEDRPL